MSVFVITILMSVFVMCIPLAWILAEFKHARRRKAQEIHQVRLRSIDERKRFLPIRITVLIALAVCALVPVVMGSLAVAGFRVPAWAVADWTYPEFVDT